MHIKSSRRNSKKFGGIRDNLHARFDSTSNFRRIFRDRRRRGCVRRMVCAPARAERHARNLAGRLGAGEFSCQLRGRDSHHPCDLRSCVQCVLPDGCPSPPVVAGVRETMESETFLSERSASHGGSDDSYETAALPALKEAGIPFEKLSVAECARRWPQIDFDGVS